MRRGRWLRLLESDELYLLFALLGPTIFAVPIALLHPRFMFPHWLVMYAVLAVLFAGGCVPTGVRFIRAQGRRSTLAMLILLVVLCWLVAVWRLAEPLASLLERQQ